MSLPESAKATLRYLRRVLVATDIWVNTLTGGLEGETISRRFARGKDGDHWVGCVMCKFLDLFQKNHCGIVSGKIPPLK